MYAFERNMLELCYVYTCNLPKLKKNHEYEIIFNLSSYVSFILFYLPYNDKKDYGRYKYSHGGFHILDMRSWILLFFLDAVSDNVVFRFIEDVSADDDEGWKEEHYPSNMTNAGGGRPKYFKVEDTRSITFVSGQYKSNPQANNLSRTCIGLR